MSNEHVIEQAAKTASELANMPECLRLKVTDVVDCEHAVPSPFHMCNVCSNRCVIYLSNKVAEYELDLYAARKALKNVSGVYAELEAMCRKFIKAMDDIRNESNKEESEGGAE